MNILLLSQFFSTTKGGGEYVFSMIAKSLADSGHKVWVITNKTEGESYPTYHNLNLVFVPPVLDYRGGIPAGFSENIKYVISAIKNGCSLIRNEKIDLIHSNNFAPALSGSIISILTGKPHITTIHDIFSLCGKDYWKLWGKQMNLSRLNIWLSPFFEKFLIHLNYDAIHTVSESSRDDLLKFGITKPIYIINNAIEYNISSTSKTNQFQFIHIGRLVFYKNLELIIKAIHLLKEEFPEVSLIFVGDGPERENLENLVTRLNLEKNVMFLGFVTAERKSNLLASSQALLFPSTCEGFGIVILEAFSHGKPVLVSNVRPSIDIISDKQNGMVLDYQNVSDWVRAMKWILNNKDEAKKIGNNGSETLKRKYSIEKFQTDIIHMYREVIGQ